MLSAAKIGWMDEGNAAICKFNPENMIVETRNTITLKEYLIACMRILYSKPITLTMAGVGLVCAVLLATGTVTAAGSKSMDFYMTWLMIIVNIIAPLSDILVGIKFYNSSKAMRLEKQYIFDDTRISYKTEGAEGSVEWKFITKYKTVKHFILLYMASRQAIFIKSDGLTPEEINFIKSKAEQTKS